MQPHIPSAIRHEFGDFQRWGGRLVFIAFAAFAGIAVVAFTWLAELALGAFFSIQRSSPWAVLLWVPLSTACIVSVTRRLASGAAGSGIPQVMAAISHRCGRSHRHLYVSLRLSLLKVLLTSWGLLAGLSIGREGPSVQVAAGVMQSARRWLPARANISDQSLLIAGGAAGIAAAFNTPLGGVMFAIEELSKGADHRNNSLVILAIVVAGMMGVSAFGNASYFGVIHVSPWSTAILFPGLLVIVLAGLTGGLLSRLIIASLSGAGPHWITGWRSRFPVRFAFVCGVAVAVIGIVSNGETFGSGYSHNKAMLDNQSETSSLYVVLKFAATWLSTWAGVPAGVFAPSLAIGGALGNDVAQFLGYFDSPTLIALGMASFLAAVTQAPLTAFIIVMEMVDGHALVLTLMAGSIVASAISRLVSAPLYTALAELQLQRIQGPGNDSPPGRTAPRVRLNQHQRAEESNRVHEHTHRDG